MAAAWIKDAEKMLLLKGAGLRIKLYLFYSF